MKLFPFALATLLSLPLFAQVIDVTGARKNNKDPISLSRLAAADPVFKQTLQSDLERSGYFYIDANAQTAVSGSASFANVTWSGGKLEWPNAKTPADARQDPRRGAHDLADQIVQQIKRKPGMASSRVLFIKRNGPDNSDLYVCDADGANIQQLTFDNRAIVGPRWDTDSKNLFLTSYINGGPVVYRMAAEPRAKKSIIANYKGLNTGAAPSYDGKSIALILSVLGNPDLFVLNRATGNHTQITKTPNASEASPVWSPDNQSILYVSDASGAPHIYLANVASKQSRRLTSSGSENVSPAWSFASNRIAYASKRDGKYQIAVLNSISDARPVILTSGAEHTDPTWMPDGRHLICVRTDSPQSSSLWMLDTEGDKPVLLFTRPGKWASPASSFR